MLGLIAFWFGLLIGTSTTLAASAPEEGQDISVATDMFGELVLLTTTLSQDLDAVLGLSLESEQYAREALNRLAFERQSMTIQRERQI